MKATVHLTIYVAALSALLCIALGCNTSGPKCAPTLPEMDQLDRRAMDFPYGVSTVFGSDEISAADVDLATVQTPIGASPDTRWVVAVAIEDPEEDPSYPVIRFLGRDSLGSPVLGQKFTVQVSPVIEDRDCRLPRVDCRLVSYSAGGLRTSSKGVSLRRICGGFV